MVYSALLQSQACGSKISALEHALQFSILYMALMVLVATRRLYGFTD